MMWGLRMELCEPERDDRQQFYRVVEIRPGGKRPYLTRFDTLEGCADELSRLKRMQYAERVA